MDSFDMVKGMLAVISKDMPKISSSTPVFHEALHRALQECGSFLSLEEECEFENRGYYHFSRSIYADLVNLTSCGYADIMGFKMDFMLLRHDELDRSFEIDVDEGVVSREDIKCLAEVFVRHYRACVIEILGREDEK